MYNQREFEKARNIFSHAGINFYEEYLDQHHVKMRPKDLLRWIDFAKNDLGYLTLVDIVGIDHRLNKVNADTQFELVYHLLNMGEHQRLNLHVYFNQDEVIPSVVKFFLHAEWMEREQREMLNITFNQEYEELILPLNQKNYPLRKDSRLEVWPVNIEKDLPALRFNPNKSEEPYPEESYIWKKFDIFSKESAGHFDWQVCFDSNRVIQANLQIGFHHQGFEKLLETKDWFHVMQLVDKINLGAAPTYSMAWAKTLEDILSIKLPERAQAIRIVMLELARIAEHLSVMAEMTMAIKLDEARLFLNAREKVYELFEKYCGHRQGTGIIRLGGVREDLPHGWIVEFQSIFDVLKKTLRIINNSLMGQRNFRAHLDSASVNAQTVLQWGVGGPTMRASGLNFDLRKSHPFYFYHDIDFDIPVGIHGTAYDRYLIRYEEIYQSSRIITQVLDNLPLGEFVNQNCDQPLGSVQEFLCNQIIPLKWQYTSLESPNGEAGFFIFPCKDLSPYRVKIKTPSFVLAQALPHLIERVREEELAANLASFGIKRFEMDR